MRSLQDANSFRRVASSCVSYDNSKGGLLFFIYTREKNSFPKFTALKFKLCPLRDTGEVPE